MTSRRLSPRGSYAAERCEEAATPTRTSRVREEMQDQRWGSADRQRVPTYTNTMDLPSRATSPVVAGPEVVGGHLARPGGARPAFAAARRCPTPTVRVVVGAIAELAARKRFRAFARLSGHCQATHELLPAACPCEPTSCDGDRPWCKVQGPSAAMKSISCGGPSEVQALDRAARRRACLGILAQRRAAVFECGCRVATGRSRSRARRPDWAIQATMKRRRARRRGTESAVQLPSTATSAKWDTSKGRRCATRSTRRRPSTSRSPLGLRAR